MDLICIYLKVATGCGNFYMLSTVKKVQTIFEKFSIHRMCKHFENTEPRLNPYTQKMRAKTPDKSRLTALKNAGDRGRTFSSLWKPHRKELRRPCLSFVPNLYHFRIIKDADKY